jgi:hypothetical protein
MERIMRLSIIAAAFAAAVGLFGAQGSAQAQSFGLYIGDEPGVGVYVGPRYRAYDRPYGYYRDSYDDGYDSPRYYRSECGSRHYWNGTRCVDARSSPSPNMP